MYFWYVQNTSKRMHESDKVRKKPQLYERTRPDSWSLLGNHAYVGFKGGFQKAFLVDF